MPRQPIAPADIRPISSLSVALLSDEEVGAAPNLDPLHSSKSRLEPAVRLRLESVALLPVDGEEEGEAGDICDPVFPGVDFAVEVGSKPPPHRALDNEEEGGDSVDTLVHQSGVKVVLRGSEEEGDLVEGHSSVFPQQLHEYLHIFLLGQDLALHLFDLDSTGCGVSFELLYLDQIAQH